MVRLAEHRPDAAHLEHEPLQSDPLAAIGLRQEATSHFRRKIDEDRARLEQRQRLAVGTLRIDDRRNAVVRIDGEEFRLELLIRADIHRLHAVRQAALLEHDGYLAPVRRAPCVQINHCGPFFYSRTWCSKHCCDRLLARLIK